MAFRLRRRGLLAVLVATRQKSTLSVSAFLFSDCNNSKTHHRSALFFIDSGPTRKKLSSHSSQFGMSTTEQNELPASQQQQQQQQQQLISYVPGMDVGGTLEEWLFDNPQSNYVIHAGTPKASGRIDYSTPTTRTGIWRCTVGTMECTEQGDELMTILSGKVEVTDVETGKIVLLQPGDSMFSFHGKRLVWNVLQDVTKVFTVPNPMDIPDI